MSRQERAPDFAGDCVLVNDSGAYARGQFLRAVSHSVGALQPLPMPLTLTTTTTKMSTAAISSSQSVLSVHLRRR